MTASVNLLESRRQRFARWVGASALVTAIHVGGASYALHYWQEQLVDEVAGAVVIEIAPITTAAHEALERPPGPLIDESASSMSASDPKLEKVTEETPKEDLPSPALEPEVTLPKPTNVEEIVKEEVRQDPSPKVEVTKEVAVAAQSTAPPPILGPKAEKAASTSIGTSAEAQRSYLSWQNSLIQHIHRHKRVYNLEKGQGTTHVRFVMDRSGSLVSSEVVRSSGIAQIDEDALAWLKRASPLPRPPLTMQGESLSFTLPMRFVPEGER